MSYNGSGTFNINTAGQPVVTGTTITSTAFNLLTADLATGLSTALTKDGQTTPTANIPLGGFKITGLGAGTAATDAAQYGQLQAGATTIATVTGTDTYVGTLSPAIAAYATGNLFSFVAPNTNTGAATINLNSLGAKNITKLGSTALAAGDIVSGRVYQIEYDGTRFQLLNPSASSVASFSAGSTGFTPSSATTGAVTLAGTLATTNGGTGLTSFTANGVVYASSSSALATGSALVFDGTNLGVGNSSPSDAVTVGTTTTGKNIRIYSSSNGNNGLFRMFDSGGTERLQLGVNTTGEAVYYSPTSSVHAWYINTEQMRLTSTGLGIGTSSPAYKLDVNGAINIGANTWNKIGTANWFYYNTSAGTINLAAGSSALIFRNQADSADLMRLDNSGNLGLGVTPSAWVSGNKALQVGGYASLFDNSGGGGGAALFGNSYEYATGAYKYTNSYYATLYRTYAGQHQWFNAPSGTAGNAITFTQAMTLDASGNLGIATTSPAEKFTLGSGNAQITGGQLTVGVTSTSGLQFINNGTFGTLDSIPLMFRTASTERARIDTSGNLLVGTTSASLGPTSGFNVIIGGGVTGTSIGHITGSSSGSYYELFAYNGSAIGSITQSGTTAVLYNLTSDQRLKENIQDAESSSNLIDSIQVRKFDWKTDQTHQRYGFIAQELVTVYPEAVHQPQDTEEMMAVDYSKLVPMLVKEIQSLRQRVAQLESN